MCVLLTHIAVIVCSIYALLVYKVDVLTDGKIWSTEMETERGENSHRSTFMATQADEKMEVDGTRYVFIFAYCIHTE